MPADATTPRPPPAALARDRAGLRRLVAGGGVTVLTGAGISTDSGIPDYRGETGRRRPGTPMSHRDFVTSSRNRQRYWARSLVGWRAFGRARPNPGHRAVARLQAAGMVGHVITQNVDGLHGAAGTRDLVELHGSLFHVRCLACDRRHHRDWLQDRLARANPAWATATADLSADGDAHLVDVAGFRVVDCPCGGTLMPDIVFFGAGVPRLRVERCHRAVAEARALLVLGSSLQVWSGLRFVRRAHELGRPVAIVNRGPTRGDDLAAVRLDTDLSATLTWLADELAGPHP